MSTVTNSSTNEEQKVMARIEIEPIPFDGLLKSKIISTIELSKLVNSVFKNAMADYEGCIILPAQNGQFDCTLYFKDHGPIRGQGDQIKNLISITGPNRGVSAVDRITAFNNRTSNKLYSLSEETKQILSEFMAVRKDQKINWNQHVFEQAEATYNANIVYLKVCGIDIVKILKKIYGGKIDGDRCDYNITLMRPTGMNNYLISIQQLDTKEVEKLALSVGIIQTGNSIAMIRD